MNKVTAAHFIPIFQAYSEGKDIEFFDGSKWTIINKEEPTFDYNPCNYRVKQAPKLRPWKPEEVPVGAAIKSKTLGQIGIITYVSKTMNGFNSTIADAGNKHFSSEALAQ